MANYDTSVRVNTKVDNSDLRKLQKDFDKLEAKLDSLYKKGDKLESLGVDKQSRQWQSLRYDVAQTEMALEDARDRIQQINNISLGETENGFTKIKNSSQKCFKTLRDGTKKSNGLLASFSSRLKGIALSLLVFNWITKGFNAMVHAMKEGFQNLAHYSSDYNKSMSDLKSQTEQLKNGLAAAFEPIVNMVIPYLTQLISWLNTAANAIGQFLAAVQGKSTYTKAKKQVVDYAKSLDTASKAAKGALASFDQLNVVSRNDSGGAGGGLTGADAFETAKVSSEFTDFVKLMKQRMAELKEIFSQGFLEGLGDPTERLNTIKSSVESIKESLLDIFDQDLAEGFNDALERVIHSLGVITGSVASVGLTIAANLLGGLSRYLEENKGRIQQYLLDMFDIGASISEKAAELCSTFAYIFEEFSGDAGQGITENLIAIFANSFMEISRLASQLGLDLLSMITDPIVNSKEELRDALGELLVGYEEFTASLEQILDECFEFINQIYDENIAPLFETFAQELEAFYQEHLAPLISSMGEFFSSLGENLSVLWNDFLKPFIQWLRENILPVITPILESIGKRVMNAYTMITDVVSGLIEILDGIITFITGVFTGDWERAWSGIEKIFHGIINSCAAIIEGFINSAIDKLNGVINAINNFALTDGLLEFMGISEIPTIPNIDIPRLANGAVIPGGRPFAAILGDQPAGQTNVETPLSTIEQALQNVYDKNGSSGDIYLTATLDGDVVYKSVVKRDKIHRKATGRSSFAY